MMTNINSERVDLHLHSNRSDGIYKPRDLIQLAASCGLKAVALTDHETMEGVDEAVSEGALCGLEVVPGVEISTFDKGIEIHLLGYYPASRAALSEELLRSQNERYTRMSLMVTRLRSLGFNLNQEQVFQEAAPAAPGRLHLARQMLKQNMVSSLDQAFSLYLNQGCPAYVPRTSFTPSTALSLLLESRAVAVMAHPGLKGKKILPGLIKEGLHGIEVYHPDHSAQDKRYYRRLAEKYSLLVTGGSDFHGDKNSVSCPGSVAVPYSLLERLKSARFG